MKKLSELNVSQAPWRFTDDGMGECDIRCSGVSYGEDYEGDDIIAYGVQKKDAPMFAAAPKLYSAGQKTEAVLSGLFKLDEFAALLKSGAADALIACRDELRAALKEASGEGDGDEK